MGHIGDAKFPFEPVYATPGSLEERMIRSRLFDVGVVEKNWPPAAMARVIAAESQLIGVFSDDECVGGTQLLYEHPYPCELKPFEYRIPNDGRVVCEVALLAVASPFRRSPKKGVSIYGTLDALIKGIYRSHLARGGTHLYSLCEQWTVDLLTTQYVQLAAFEVGTPAHYWCGTETCPSNECNLTHVCEIDIHGCEENWRNKRPDFWEYANR